MPRRRRVEPDGQRSTLTQRRVVVRPVQSAVAGGRRPGREAQLCRWTHDVNPRHASCNNAPPLRSRRRQLRLQSGDGRNPAPDPTAPHPGERYSLLKCKSIGCSLRGPSKGVQSTIDGQHFTALIELYRQRGRIRDHVRPHGMQSAERGRASVSIPAPCGVYGRPFRHRPPGRMDAVPHLPQPRGHRLRAIRVLRDPPHRGFDLPLGPQRSQVELRGRHGRLAVRQVDHLRAGGPRRRRACQERRRGDGAPRPTWLPVIGYPDPSIPCSARPRTCSAA